MVMAKPNHSGKAAHSSWYVDAMEHFIEVVQELSHARTLDEVMHIVRTAARELTGADGATFVLRDGDKCYYADEDAIEPLWKGQRFPMSACISGWVMMRGETAYVEDIYADERIPVAAYRPTFVRSLVMVPIRRDAPIGAIGNYWAQNRLPAPGEIEILESLANITSVALENVELYGQLQGKIAALEESNEELSRFAWIASHDLKSPLRSIDNLSQWIEEDVGKHLTTESRAHMDTLRKRVRRMEKLLDDVLDYAQIDRKMGVRKECLMSAGELIADAIDILNIPPGFQVDIIAKQLPDNLPAMPLQLVFRNLIGNAVKHHASDNGHIWIDVSENDTHHVFVVSDDGPGVPKQYRETIFDMFKTLKSRDEVEGSGMGLAFAKKALERGGGTIRVWDREGGTGAAFEFTWPKGQPI